MSALVSTKKSYIDPRDLRTVDRAILRRVLGSLQAYRLRGLVVLGLLVVVAGMHLLPPLLIREVVDGAIPARDVVLLVLLCAGMVVAPLLAGLLQVLQKVLTTRTSEQVMRDLRVKLFAHLQAQPLAYFTLARPGEALSRVLNDVQGAGAALASTLVTVASNLVTFSLALATVLWLDWRLALIALVLMPAYVIPTRRVGRRRKALKRHSQWLMAQLTGLLAETLSISGAQLIKVSGTEEVETDRVRAKGQQLMDVNVRQALTGRWFIMVLGVIESVGPALVFAFGGLLVMRGELGLGTVVAFVALIASCTDPRPPWQGCTSTWSPPTPTSSGSFDANRLRVASRRTGYGDLSPLGEEQWEKIGARTADDYRAFFTAAVQARAPLRFVTSEVDRAQDSSDAFRRGIRSETSGLKLKERVADDDLLRFSTPVTPGAQLEIARVERSAATQIAATKVLRRLFGTTSSTLDDAWDVWDLYAIAPGMGAPGMDIRLDAYLSPVDAAQLAALDDAETFFRYGPGVEGDGGFGSAADLRADALDVPVARGASASDHGWRGSEDAEMAANIDVAAYRKGRTVLVTVRFDEEPVEVLGCAPSTYGRYFYDLETLETCWS